jgi:hypothetical protein
MSGQFYAPRETCPPIPPPFSLNTRLGGPQKWQEVTFIARWHATCQNMPDGTCYNDQVRTNINGQLSHTTRFRAGPQIWLEVSKFNKSIIFRLADRHSLTIMCSTCVNKLPLVSVRLKYDATSMGAWCPTFRVKVVASSSRVETSNEELTSKNWQWDVEKLRKGRRFCCL